MVSIKFKTGTLTSSKWSSRAPPAETRTFKKDDHKMESPKGNFLKSKFISSLDNFEMPTQNDKLQSKSNQIHF